MPECYRPDIPQDVLCSECRNRGLRGAFPRDLELTQVSPQNGRQASIQKRPFAKRERIPTTMPVPVARAGALKPGRKSHWPPARQSRSLVP